VRLLVRLDTVLFRLEQLLIWVMLSGLTLLSFLQVLLRNLFGLGFPGLDILLRHLVLWLAILGASLATRTGRHIRIDLPPHLFTSGQRKILQQCIPVLSGAISLLFCLAAVDLVRQERAAGSIAFGTVPTWLLQLILPLGFAIFAFRFTLQGFLEGAEPPRGRTQGEGQWTG
jgi:TRAP-type C4-dicarboxylate transport system permease small subunit